MKEEYIPVSCDLLDKIEILATYKKQVLVVYADNDEFIEEQLTIKTWETSNKEEFLIAENGLKIRLDQIMSLNGETFKKTC